MKLYIISERAAKYLMMAPKALGGYVLTGEAYIHLPQMDGYISKLPDCMADSGRPMTGAEAAACIALLDRGMRHAGEPGIMGRLAAEAAEVSGMIRADLVAVAA